MLLLLLLSWFFSFIISIVFDIEMSKGGKKSDQE